jgi:hypothetical protein
MGSTWEQLADEPAPAEVVSLTDETVVHRLACTT